MEGPRLKRVSAVDGVVVGHGEVFGGWGKRGLRAQRVDDLGAVGVCDFEGFGGGRGGRAVPVGGGGRVGHGGGVGVLFCFLFWGGDKNGGWGIVYKGGGGRFIYASICLGVPEDGD